MRSLEAQLLEKVHLDFTPTTALVFGDLKARDMQVQAGSTC